MTSVNTLQGNNPDAPILARGSYVYPRDGTRFRVHSLDGETDDARIAGAAISAGRLGDLGLGGMRIEAGEIPEVSLLEHDASEGSLLGFSSRSDFIEVSEALGYHAGVHGPVWNILMENHLLSLGLTRLRKFMVKSKEELQELAANDSVWSQRKQAELEQEYKELQWRAKARPLQTDLEHDPLVVVPRWRMSYLFMTRNRRQPGEGYADMNRADEVYVDMDALYRLEARGKPPEYTHRTGVVRQNIINSFVNAHILEQGFRN